MLTDHKCKRVVTSRVIGSLDSVVMTASQAQHRVPAQHDVVGHEGAAPPHDGVRVAQGLSLKHGRRVAAAFHKLRDARAALAQAVWAMVCECGVPVCVDASSRQ